MTTLSELHRAVQATLASKQLGRPVFVRYLVQGAKPDNGPLPQLARIAVLIQSWFGQPLARLQAIGSSDQASVALTLTFRDGTAALVSFTLSPTPSVDLTILGNHGAAYHTLDGDVLPQIEKAAPDPKVLAALETALRTGKPETFSAGGQP